MHKHNSVNRCFKSMLYRITTFYVIIIIMYCKCTYVLNVRTTKNPVQPTYCKLTLLVLEASSPLPLCSADRGTGTAMDQTSETEKVYQQAKYHEILEVLLTAGYFRARIGTLSEFDKVVGGLCWCLVSSGEVVDVDILFQENSTIGQRISLSEAIVKVLRKMNCPIPLQPHQIQGGVGGSDYPTLLQVIVWLIKKYFERRDEKELQMKSFSLYQFKKHYNKSLSHFDEHHAKSDYLMKVINRNKAVRHFRRKEAAGESEERRVRSCLLEFGETFMTKSDLAGDGSNGNATVGAASSAQVTIGSSPVLGIAEAAASAVAARALRSSQQPVKEEGGAVGWAGSEADITLAGLSKLDITELSAFEKQLAKAAREAKREELLLSEQLSKEEVELKQQMKEIAQDGAAGVLVSGSQVGSIVGLGIDQIGSAAAAYQAEVEESRKQLDESLAAGKLGKAAALNRQKQQLSKAREELVAKEREVHVESEKVKATLKVLEEERSDALHYQEQLLGQARKLSELEKLSSQKEEFSIVQQLIAKHEELKAEEIAFKAQCKLDRQAFLDTIKELDTALGDDDPESSKLRDLQDLHEKISSKHGKMRQVLADANLEAAHLQRAIDDCPTRTELIQYERRFVELYQQVSWKLDETRKYFDIYNTLETTLTFIQKEVRDRVG